MRLCVSVVVDKLKNGIVENCFKILIDLEILIFQLPEMQPRTSIKYLNLWFSSQEK